MVSPAKLTPESVMQALRGKGLLSMRQICFDISRDLSPEQTFSLARILFHYPDVYGAMAATLMAGHVSFIIPEALEFLRTEVPTHTNIRVQDCLAKALDHFCLNRGFERAMPVLEAWSRDFQEFVRRAAIEAPRPWTRKEYFKARPEMAISFISTLSGDPSHYVRFSVGHALSEISKDFPELVAKELESWNTFYTPVRNTYLFASRHLKNETGLAPRARYEPPAKPSAGQGGQKEPGMGKETVGSQSQNE
jgi:3-methyladenine DNA glycosylase AlkC